MSIYKNERPKLEKLCSVILLVRNYLPRYFDFVSISDVIFVDLGLIFNQDAQLIQFLSRNSSPKIHRILYDYSVETSVYHSLIHAPFKNFNEINENEAEIFLRCIYKSSMPNYSSPSPTSNFRISHSVTEPIPSLCSLTNDVCSTTPFWKPIYVPHRNVVHQTDTPFSKFANITRKLGVIDPQKFQVI